MKNALNATLVVVSWWDEFFDLLRSIEFDIVRSLRRYYPDQVHRGRRPIVVLSAGCSQLPRYLHVRGVDAAEFRLNSLLNSYVLSLR